MYVTFSEIQISSKEMEVNSLFLTTSKAKLPARVLHQYSSREKNEHNIR